MYKIYLLHLSPHGDEWFKEEIEVSEETYKSQLNKYMKKWIKQVESLEHKWEIEQGSNHDFLVIDAENINAPKELFGKIYKEVYNII